MAALHFLDYISLRTPFVGGLLYRVYDELYCLWYNALLCYIGTFVRPA